MLRSAANASPGGAGAGGSFFIDASAGKVTGTGTISVRGGAGGSGYTGGTCGGGGGGGGGALQISAPMADPNSSLSSKVGRAALLAAADSAAKPALLACSSGPSGL